MLLLTYTILFFFQAEDGIRDADVTGVQTCALPISPARRSFPCVPAKIAALAPGNTAATSAGNRASSSRQTFQETFPMLLSAAGCLSFPDREIGRAHV